MMHTFWMVAVIALVTALLRFLPFVVFRKHTPEAILYLGRVLPYAVMAMLVVYCLKGMVFTAVPYGIPEMSAIAVVVVLHKWKHHTLLSILAGTLSYMLLIRII